MGNEKCGDTGMGLNSSAFGIVAHLGFPIMIAIISSKTSLIIEGGRQKREDRRQLTIFNLRFSIWNLWFLFKLEFGNERFKIIKIENRKSIHDDVIICAYVTTPFDKPVLSEPFTLRQAQGER